MEDGSEKQSASTPWQPSRPGSDLEVSSYACSFRAAYKIQSSWGIGSEEPTLQGAPRAIDTWRKDYKFDFQMKIIKTEKTEFFVP